MMSKSGVYSRRPYDVRAVRWMGRNRTDIMHFVESIGGSDISFDRDIGRKDFNGVQFAFANWEDVWVNEGEWIVFDVGRNEVETCEDETFHELYEPKVERLLDLGKVELPEGLAPDVEVFFEEKRPQQILSGCPVEVTDGPYLMRCARGAEGNVCSTHGRFTPAFRCNAQPRCTRPEGHGGRCLPPGLGRVQKAS